MREIKEDYKMNKKIVLLFFALLLLVSKSAFAVIDMRIQPVEGGNEVRFGKVGAYIPYISKAVTVSITADVNQQYQLVQTLVEPLANTQGFLLPASSFSVYAIKDGKATGTLNAERELPVSEGRAVVYTSDIQGMSASFTLVYVLKNSENILPGSYQGKLVFMVESPGAAQPVAPVVITITADIESLGTFVDITTATGAKTIVLNSAKAETSSFDLVVDIKKSLKEQFEISQSVTRLPESRQGKQLFPETLTVSAHGHRRGGGTAGSMPLTKGEQTLYISGTGGDEDCFVITYSLVDFEKQNAGNYQAEVQYFLKTQSGQKFLGNFALDITIDRLLDLTVTPEHDSGIRFQDVRLDQRPSRSEIVVEIRSNLGRQYQVSQQLPAALVNNEGKSIPSRYFTLRLADVGTKGLLQFDQPTAVKTGEMVLFVSDKDGSPDKFRIIYEFSADAHVEAGDYTGRIVYTISEL